MARNKREIDKEIMFNKIMPTSLLAASDASEKVVSPAEVSEQTPVKTNPQFIGDSGVQLQKKEHTILVNIMEYLVTEKLDSAFAKFNCCKCDKCKKDVAAIALNKLKPKYVVIQPDKVSEAVAQQNGAEVATALVQGILHVRSHPRH